MNEIIIQIIGFVAVAAFILSYQIKSNRWLFLLQIVGSQLTPPLFISSWVGGNNIRARTL